MNPVITLARSRLGPWLGLLIGSLPRGSSSWLADRLAAWAASQPDNHAVRAVRANQSIVRGMPLEDPALNEIVFRVFKNAAHGYLTFFRGMARRSVKMASRSSVDPKLVEKVGMARSAGRGVFIVGPHMGNIDISLMALHANDVRPLVLSVRNPSGSHEVDVAIRQRYGFEFLPISMQSLRIAFQRLKSGGVVLTMVDLPDEAGESLPFFGHAARLPTGHVRMAIRTGASIQTAAALKHEGGYRIFWRGSHSPSRRPEESEPEAVRRVAAAVLEDLEADIRRRPDEWLMFHPVWPQVTTPSS